MALKKETWRIVTLYLNMEHGVAAIERQYGENISAYVKP